MPPHPARLRATGPLDKYLLGAQGLWSKARFCSRLAICPWTKYNSTFHTRALHFLGCKTGRKPLLIRESPLSARRKENKDAESSTGRPLSALPEWELHPLPPREAMRTPRSTQKAHARKPNEPPQEGTSPPTGGTEGDWRLAGGQLRDANTPWCTLHPPANRLPCTKPPSWALGTRREERGGHPHSRTPRTPRKG